MYFWIKDEYISDYLGWNALFHKIEQENERNNRFLSVSSPKYATKNGNRFYVFFSNISYNSRVIVWKIFSGFYAYYNSRYPLVYIRIFLGSPLQLCLCYFLINKLIFVFSPKALSLPTVFKFFDHFWYFYRQPHTDRHNRHLLSLSSRIYQWNLWPFLNFKTSEFFF